MWLDKLLNDASLSYQYLADSIAENYEKYKHIASLEQNIANHENTPKTKDEHIAYLKQNIINHENTLKTKGGHLERHQKLNNSLINFTPGGRMALASLSQGSQFVPQGPQVIARTIPPPIVPKAFPPIVPKTFQHRSGRSAPYPKVEHYS